MDKKILDVTCGSRGMWFNKSHPATLYTDIRRESHIDYGKKLEIDPDQIADFRDLPFEDNTFHLVVMDPPHLERLNSNGWFIRKYGTLFPTWEEDLRLGVNECMRVLKPNGVLIFKWSSVEIKLPRLLKALDYEPLFGHSTGNNLKTAWLTFMKL